MSPKLQNALSRAFCSETGRGVNQKLSGDSYLGIESNVIFNVLGGIGWVGIVPSHIGEVSAICIDVVIAGNTLPRTSGVAVIGGEVFHLDRLGGKV